MNILLILFMLFSASRRFGGEMALVFTSQRFYADKLDNKYQRRVRRNGVAGAA
jgi:hypothetical protein